MSVRALLATSAVAVNLFSVSASAPAAELGRPRSNWVVDDSARPCQVARAVLRSIQTAVDMAKPGDVISVCPGVYRESVRVGKAGLRLRGARAGIRGTRPFVAKREAIVEPGQSNSGPGIYVAADSVAVDGFTVRGHDIAGLRTASGGSGYRIENNIVTDNAVGLRLSSDGDRRSVVRRNRFMANNRNGDPSGNGIYASGVVHNVVIATNRFEGGRGVAVLLALGGTDQTGVVIRRNRSMNDFGFLAMFNREGLPPGVSDVDVSANTVLNHSQDVIRGGPAIFVGGPSTRVAIVGNRIGRANQAGIEVNDGVGGPITSIVIGLNRITKSGGDGIHIMADAVGVVQVRDNTLRRNMGNGIRMGLGTNGNTISGNRAAHNAMFDCVDTSYLSSDAGSGTAGTNNFWSRNAGLTAVPRGICSRETSTPTTGAVRR